MTTIEQYMELSNHVQTLEPGMTLPIYMGAGENARSVATRINEALRDMPNRREFEIRARPLQGRVEIFRKRLVPNMLRGEHIGQDKLVINMGPNIPGLPGIPSQITDPHQAYRKHITDLMEGNDLAESTYILMSTGSEEIPTRDQSLGMILFHMDNLVAEQSSQISGDLEKRRKAQNAFSVLTSGDTPSSNGLSSSDSLNEKDEDRAIPEKEWYEEED